MGCNTSQEQLQGGSSVIENEPSNENNDGSNGESKQSDDNQNVTNREKAALCNAINTSKDTPADSVDKAAAGAGQSDNSISGHTTSNECVEDKDDGNEECVLDSQRIKSEMQHSKELDEEERAATRIQATFRGHRVRASMKQGDKSSSSSSTSTGASATPTKMEKKCEDKKTAAAASVACADSNNQEEEEELTREQLEAEFDPNDKELCDAAVRIQSAFRCHLKGKLQTADIKDDKDLEEITKKVAEELDIDLTDPELNKAATKIQASFRGYRTRKHDDDEDEKDDKDDK